MIKKLKVALAAQRLKLLSKFIHMNNFSSEVDHNALDSPESLLIGSSIQNNKLKAAMANPITYVNGDIPPFLIMHADNDPLVPLNQSQLLFDALRHVNIEVSFEIVTSGGHGDKFSSRHVLQKVEAFFRKHLKNL
jgi:dipeptidyl aminopeptidase/acylaminoacyl peptidase